MKNRSWMIARRHLSVWVLLGCLGTPLPLSADEEVRIEGVEVLWVGTYEAHPGLRCPPVLKETKHVPARVGVHFGVCFVIKAVPEEGLITLRFRTHFPEPGRPGADNERLADANGTADCALGAPCLVGYVTERADLLPGTWLFELSFRSQRILEQRFVMETERSPGI